MIPIFNLVLLLAHFAGLVIGYASFRKWHKKAACKWVGILIVMGLAVSSLHISFNLFWAIRAFLDHKPFFYESDKLILSYGMGAALCVAWQYIALRQAMRRG